MKSILFKLLLMMALVFAVSCGPDDEENNQGDTGNTGNSGDTGNSGNSGDSGDSGNTGNTGDTGNSGNTGNTGDSGNTGGEEEETCGPGLLKTEWETETWKKGDDDSDGIPNSAECSDCPCNDTDGDGMPDYMDNDSDGDGYSDNEECPSQPCKNSDKDDVPDYIDKDSDNDGLSDKKEKEGGTDPYNKDSDGDGSDDLAEIAYGSDPLNDGDSIPAGIFYVVLPYNAPEDVTRTLTFSTKIEAIDVLIVFDRSASMSNEVSNLRSEIKTQIIDAIAAKFTSPGFAAYGLASFGYNSLYVMNQTMTLSTDEIKSAVDSLNAKEDNETTTEALYQAATGEGIMGHYYTKLGAQQLFPVDANVPKQDCNGKLGSVGGACFRKKTMPIFIVITDEAFTTCYLINEAPAGQSCIWSWANPEPHNPEEAIAAMNGIGAKFIGIDSGFDDNGNPDDQAKNDFNLYAQSTYSLDKDGNPFLYHTDSDNGTGIGGKIADAVISLTTWIDMDVTTGKMSDDNCYGASAADFIKSSKTITADPVNGVDHWDDKTFYSVTQGTDVTFDVRFYNDFCINNNDNYMEFKAQVTVLGNGSYLSSRLVTVIVPESAPK